MVRKIKRTALLHWMLAAALGALAGAAANATEAPKPTAEKRDLAREAAAINWDRVMLLEGKRRAGRLLTIEEDAYLDHAWEVRRAQKEAQAEAARSGGRGGPTYANVRYFDRERNGLDFWPARSGTPTPVAVFIHGGGYRVGDKNQIDARMIAALVGAGVSVASINHRLISDAPLPAAYTDAARAVQFLRSKAAEWNIDKSRIAAFGDDSGGCIALWLALHPDLAKPESDDPVERESSRLACAAASNAQTTMDVNLLVEWLGKRILDYPGLAAKYGADSAQELLDSPRLKDVYAECSPIRYAKEGAPPIFLAYDRAATPITDKTDPQTLMHHPIFGQKLKEALDPLKVECVLRAPSTKPAGPYAGITDFLIQKLGGKRTEPEAK